MHGFARLHSAIRHLELDKLDTEEVIKSYVDSYIDKRMKENCCKNLIYSNSYYF